MTENRQKEKANNMIFHLEWGSRTQLEEVGHACQLMELDWTWQMITQVRKGLRTDQSKATKQDSVWSSEIEPHLTTDSHLCLDLFTNYLDKYSGFNSENLINRYWIFFFSFWTSIIPNFFLYHRFKALSELSRHLFFVHFSFFLFYFLPPCTILSYFVFRKKWKGKTPKRKHHL